MANYSIKDYRDNLIKALRKKMGGVDRFEQTLINNISKANSESEIRSYLDAFRTTNGQIVRSRDEVYSAGQAFLVANGISGGSNQSSNTPLAGNASGPASPRPGGNTSPPQGQSGSGGYGARPTSSTSTSTNRNTDGYGQRTGSSTSQDDSLFDDIGGWAEQNGIDVQSGTQGTGGPMSPWPTSQVPSSSSDTTQTGTNKGRGAGNPQTPFIPDSVTRDELRNIIIYASAGKLTNAQVSNYVHQYWLIAEKDGNLTYNEAAKLIANDPSLKAAAAGPDLSPEVNRDRHSSSLPSGANTSVTNSSADVLNEYKATIIAKFNEYKVDFPTLQSDGSLERAINDVYGANTLAQAQSAANSFVSHVGQLAQNSEGVERTAFDNATSDLYTTVGTANNLSNSVSITDESSGTRSESSPINHASNTTYDTQPQSSNQFKLIKGDGPGDNGKPLRENGNAVFLVSGAGELFHVTENLANEMQSNGTWTEPEVKSQEEIKGMALRVSLNHTAELGVLDKPSGGQFMLMRGDGAHLSTSQLEGNGDAVYAVDRDGNRFHVTEKVYGEMQQNGTWAEPVVLNQNTVDKAPLKGALASASGGVADLSIPVTPENIVTVAANAASGVLAGASAGANAGSVSSVQPSAAPPKLELIQGNAPGTGESQLQGNGAAVYAVVNGTRLHVTAAMAQELKNKGLWTTPKMMDQGQVDAMSLGGTLASTDGQAGALVIPNIAPAAAPAPAPTPPPVATPPAPVNLGSPEQRNQIAAWYKQYMGRDASAGEIDHYGGAIGRGEITLDQANLDIANAQESKSYQQAVMAQVAADEARMASINAQVDSLFRQYVGRAADGDDLRIHGSALASGGVSQEQLASQLSAAPESQAFRSNLINQTFNKYVGRAADKDDHQIHGTMLASGQVNPNQFVANIANAPEAIAYQDKVGMPRYTQ